MVCKIKS
ncbi:hypothetical protein D021_0788A, partial [Vibrio parahaemolyticus 10296]